MKIFKKKKSSNGRRHIYFCGIKVFSYTSRNADKSEYTNLIPVKYISEDILPVFLRDKFYKYTGKLPTENLETLREKIIWASMFDVTPMKIQCADKYKVRDYVEKTIGKKYLPDLYYTYKTPDEFDIEKLPKSFVLSLNSGSGQNMVVFDKSQHSTQDYKNIIRQWLLYNHSESCCEMQYRYIKPRVIARELLDIRQDIEYKLWCFDGKVEFIQLVNYTYGHDDIGSCHFDKQWKKLDFYRAGKGWHSLLGDWEKPKFLAEMIKIAEKLAKPFNFVRVDFYETKSSELKFGELTFSPTAGSIIFEPDNEKMQKYLGNLFKLPKRDDQGFAIHKK